MNEITFNILKLVKESLGNLGPALLKEEMDKNGFVSLSKLSDKEKKRFISIMINNLFKYYSINKQSVIRSKLISILKFSDEAKHRFNEQAAMDFLMGR